MKDSVRLDSLDVIKKSYNALKNQDVKELSTLSNQTIHNALVFQDKFSISFAIIIYSLSKVFEKRPYRDYKNWDEFCKNCLSELKSAKEALEMGDVEKYSLNLKNLFSLIKELDKKVNLYVEEVLDSTRIKKGSKLYEHGISVGMAADMLGITKWDLMNYIGNTRISEQDVKTKTVLERLNYTKKIFNLR